MDHIPSADATREVTGSLRRDLRARPFHSTRPTDLVRFAAVVCLGAAFVFDGLLVLLVLSGIGSAALWLTFRHDDRATERAVAAAFDRTTGLPLATALEAVLADDVVMRPLDDRLAVIAVDVPEIATRRAAGDRATADALLAAMVGRLRRQGWATTHGGPFGPLVFLRPPSGFYVVLRDVLDDRTTDWLAGRLLDVLDAPVPSAGEDVAPRVALGVAVGRVDERAELVWRATEARCRARRDGGGVATATAPRPRVDPHLEEWLVRVDDDTVLGRLFRPTTPRAELFTELAAFLRALDRAASWAGPVERRAVVALPPTTLLHHGVTDRIVTRVHEAGLHGRLALLAPACLAHRPLPALATTLDRLHRFGVRVYLDRGTGRLPVPAPAHFDGTVVTDPVWAATGADHPVVATVVAAPGAGRIIPPGHATQLRPDHRVAAR